MPRPKLLLADDSVAIRKVVELTFADEGIDVFAVPDAQSAMERFVEIQPDIVLVDAGLSGTTGYHICEMIKEDEATRHIPVLLLVGSFEPFDDDAAKRACADGVITKPFQSIRELVAKVYELLPGDISSGEDVSGSDFAPAAADVGEEDDAQAAADTVQAYDASTAAKTGRPYIHPAENQDTDEIDTAVTVPAIDIGEIDGIYADSPEESSAGVRGPAPVAYEGLGVDDELIEAIRPHQEEIGQIERFEADTAEDAARTVKGFEFDWSPAARVEESMDAAGSYRADETRAIEIHSDQDEQPELTSEPFPAESTHETSPVAVREIDDDSDDDAYPTETSEQLQTEEERIFPPVAETPEVSPELISLIAQRVIERLSDRVVREVAQEAVPRIAEKLIREALDEEKTR